MKMINHNVLVAPQFPDGEIVNAFLVRLLSYGGQHTLNMAARRLLNRRPGLDGMPSSLGKFHEELGHLYGDVDWLIDRHTEYNFYCCGLPKNKFEDQRNRLIEMMRGPVRLCRLPLLFNASENCFLQCPECAITQKTEFGFDFIHRRTRAPFVNVCSIHGNLLVSSHAQMRLFDERCQREPNCHEVQRTMELGKRIEHCMETPANASQYQKDEVIAQLIKSGWMVNRKRVQLSQLIASFSLYFKGSFADERLELMCQSSSYIEKALRSLVRSDRAVHPEWCVLLKWFAEEQHHVHRFANREPITVRIPAATPVVQSYIPSPQSIQNELENGRTLPAIAHSMGISNELLRALCKRSSLDVAWRPKLITPELAAGVSDAFRNGMLPKDVAKAFNISLGSAYRQLSILDEVELPSKRAFAQRIQEDKAEWLLHRAENEGLSRNAMRKTRMALWMRLYRNAPDWLEANSPAPLPRKRSANTRPARTLIRTLNEVLSAASDECRHPEKKRVYVSQNLLRAKAGISPYAMKSLVSKGEVSEFAEPRSTFVSSRLELVLAKRVVGRPVEKLAMVAKEAGLRTETVRRALKK